MLLWMQLVMDMGRVCDVCGQLCNMSKMNRVEACERKGAQSDESVTRFSSNGYCLAGEPIDI